MPTKLENRQWQRHSVLSPATLWFQAPSDAMAGASARVLNVSLGGAGVLCSRPPGVGASVQLRFDLEGEGLEVSAIVVHAHVRRAGLLFTRSCRTSFATLHRFVRRREARSLTARATAAPQRALGERP